MNNSLSWQQRNEQTIGQALAIIRHVPFSRMVALTGSIAESRETEKSDIDFFIQVEKGHIFTARFIITFLLRLRGIARTDTDITGKICLNWYATYNAPQEQEGRLFKVIWKNDHPTKTQLFFEHLLPNDTGKRLEIVLKNYQINRIERDKRTHLPGSQVRYSDTELGLHPPKPSK